jgi:DNA polymerase elongation subunit (family B)
MLNYENVFMSKFTLYERLFDTDTKESIIRKADYKPEIFTKSKGNRETGWKYFLDESINLEKHSFDDEREYKDFLKFQEQIGATTYGQIQAPYSHIRNNYYKNKTDFKSRIWYFDIETRVLPNQGFPYPDETPSAISMFQIYDNFLNKIIILADKNISPEKKNELMAKHKNLVFRSFNTEEALFNAFFQMIHNLKPCIITAWNGNNFDFPYITNRAKKIGLHEGNLSLVNNASTRVSINKVTNEKEYSTNWDGIYLLDMMELYKKFTYITQISYSLENVTQVELGVGKVDYGNFKNISDFMHGDWDKFVEYGIQDVVLLDQLDKKLNLVELTRMIAYKMGVNVDDALGTVKPWATYLTNIGYDRGLIMPNKNESDYTGIAGGWVANPKKGKHEWIVSFDFSSLYPSTMRWNNMSPETILRDEELTTDLRLLKEKIYYLEDPGDGLENDPWSKNERFINLYTTKADILHKAAKALAKNDVSCGVNGVFFRKHKLGIIPELIKQIYGGRKEAKKKMFVHQKNIQDFKEFGKYDEITEQERLVSFYDTEQMALKILMNSLYGAMANKHFMLFNQGLAEAITANGRMINQFCSLKIEEYMKEYTGKPAMIYGDTDSCYITLKHAIPVELLKENDKSKITDWCNDFCSNELQKVIDNALSEVSTLVNAYEPEAQAEDREIIADSGFWVAKKKYACRVLDTEGVRLKEPKLKVMGLEIVRSNTPTYCRKKLKESVEIILDKEESEVQEYILDVKHEFSNQSIDMISRITGVSNLNYELNTAKSIPINSRAGLVHNALMDKLELQKDYEYITSSDKIKYVFLKVPNPAFNQNVIGYKDPKFLEDSGLYQYIDKDEMFNKFFLSPMDIMLKPLNWSAYKINDFSEWE